MRIAAKHLRYALELFEHCWGPPIAFFARKTAGLQSSLGKLHDCDVWIEDFGKAAMNDESASDFESKSATIWLLNHFVKLRSKQFGRALNQWHEWEAKEFGKQLRECLMLQSA
jgi:CHAD domain-containing protein